MASVLAITTQLTAIVKITLPGAGMLATQPSLITKARLNRRLGLTVTSVLLNTQEQELHLTQSFGTRFKCKTKIHTQLKI